MALQMNFGGPFDVGAVAGTRQSAIADPSWRSGVRRSKKSTGEDAGPPRFSGAPGEDAGPPRFSGAPGEDAHEFLVSF
ncbi:hypothetical protein HAX54_044088 [Datura stramonium]|uniref:Uncharacterized protein n=1 Tax=Datura stramonium TaxID=4076 RepID=A0ABS8W240_DATST|nr:hypothetical protein [Datura stramonium]